MKSILTAVLLTLSALSANAAKPFMLRFASGENRDSELSCVTKNAQLIKENMRVKWEVSERHVVFANGSEKDVYGDRGILTLGNLRYDAWKKEDGTLFGDPIFFVYVPNGQRLPSYLPNQDLEDIANLITRTFGGEPPAVQNPINRNTYLSPLLLLDGGLWELGWGGITYENAFVGAELRGCRLVSDQ